MKDLPNIKFYCSLCSQPSRLVAYREEPYPGYFVTLFTSECCDAGLVDHNNKPFFHNTLAREYDNQRSWEVIDD